MIYLPNAFERISQQQPDTSLKDLNYFYSVEIIDLFQRAILEGELYDKGAELQLTILKSAILSLNEKAPSAEGKEDPDAINLSSSIKTLCENYLPALSAVAEAIKTSVNNLSQNLDGVIVPTRDFHFYNNLKTIAALIKVKDDEKSNINKYNIFVINLHLSCLDDYLECSELNINDLQDALAYLNSLTGSENVHEGVDAVLYTKDILNKLRHKAAFLLFKIEDRNAKNNRKSIAEKRPGTDNSYTHFTDCIFSHYSDSPDVEALKSQVLGFRPDDIAAWRLEPFHHLSRYFRKQGDTSGVKLLIDKLDELYPKNAGLSLYDQNAFNSIYKLVKNSALQLQFDKIHKEDYAGIIKSLGVFLSGTYNSKTNMTELDLLKKQLQEEFEQHRFPDYYSYLLLIRLLNKLIKELIRHPEKILTVELYAQYSQGNHISQKADDMIAHIKKIHDDAQHQLDIYLNIMMSHKVKPVSLRMQESMVPCSWTVSADSVKPGNLFLESSYILPLDFNKVKIEAISFSMLLNQQLNFLKNAFDITLSHLRLDKNITDFNSLVQQNKTEIEKETKKIGDDAKRYEFRAVQIIAMFVSIATFVLINVKIFDNKSALESFGIILGLAGCFILFNMFFYVTSVLQLKEQHDAKDFVKRFWPVLILLIGFLLSSWGLLHCEKGETATNIKDMDKRIYADSVNMEKVKVKQNELEGYQKAQGYMVDSIFTRQNAAKH